MYAALLALGMLSTGFGHAADTEKAHVIKKKSVYKKAHKTAPKKTAAKKKSYRINHKSSKHPYKNVTKRAVNPAATTAATAPIAATATQTPVAASKTTEPTAYQKLGNWLGLGAGVGTTAAAKEALIGHHRVAGYHIGPRDWHHNFPEWWVKQGRGWTAADVDGVWYFGGHPIEWWASKPEYESYYKNVIRPEYLKAHPEKR